MLCSYFILKKKFSRTVWVFSLGRKRVAGQLARGCTYDAAIFLLDGGEMGFLCVDGHENGGLYGLIS